MATVIHMAQLEKELDRGRSTIRIWIANEWLPSECMPSKDDNGWQCWTPDQVEQITSWMANRNQGRVQKSISRTRRPEQ
jgi:hypothetical protein